MGRQDIGLVSVLAVLVVSGCSDPDDGDGQGRTHDPACEEPLLNDDFLDGTLDPSWQPRPGTDGSHELLAEGDGADRRGFLLLRDSESDSDIALADRSAYGVTQPLADGDVSLRAMLISAPADYDVISGVLVERDQDNLVAVGVRGIDDIAQVEFWCFENGEFRVGGSGSPTNAGQVLLELTRHGDEWVGVINGTEAGRAQLPLSGDLRVGPFVGSPAGQVAEARVEWIEACP